MIKSFPLSWPSGWRQTTAEKRRPAYFKRHRQSITIAAAVTRVLDQLRRFGFEDTEQIIISTNLKPRLDGWPISGQKAPDEIGVAVYWKHVKDLQYKVMAIDGYSTVADNLAAVAATLEALRAVERHGGAIILDRAFSGFTCLPEPNNWRHELGLTDQSATLSAARQAFRRLALVRHPDQGGSEEAMARLNRAWEDAQRELAP